MARCTATATTGGQCKAYATSGSEFCFWHDPSQGHERAKARKRGGERRRTPHVGDPYSLPQRIDTIAEANKILDYCLAEVLPMENSIARARVLLSIHESYVKAIEIGELEQRLHELEKALAQRSEIEFWNGLGTSYSPLTEGETVERLTSLLNRTEDDTGNLLQRYMNMSDEQQADFWKSLGVSEEV